MSNEKNYDNKKLAMHIAKMVLINLDDRSGCPDWLHPTRGGDAGEVRKDIAAEIHRALELLR